MKKSKPKPKQKIPDLEMLVDYRYRATMPIRDMHNNGQIVFVVDIYGLTSRDLCLIPGGADPMLKAVRRIGMDTERYQAMIWDVNL